MGARIAGYLRRHHVALLALFLGLGGTSYAASQVLVPVNSVGSAQVINRSLRTIDLSRSTVARLHGRRGLRGLRGLQGPTGTQGPTGPRGPTGAAGVSASRLFAGLSAAGTIFKGAGTVSATHPATGRYEVNFNTSIRGCAYLATAADSGAIMQTVGSERYAGPPEQVRVLEYTSGGAPTDGAFDLAVVC
jgi:hypothetical protein